MQLAQLKVTINGLFLALGVAGLVSCGSGDEAGGGGACGGAENTGVCLFVESIVVSDVDEGPDIDVFLNPDCNGDGTLDDPEPFVIARAEVTFGASQVGPEPPIATQIIITGYTITYTAIPPTPPVVAAAILPVTFTGNTVTIPVNGTATALVDVFNFTQKFAWAAGYTGGVTYSVRYDFVGEDDFGESVSVAASTFIDLDGFNNC